MMDGYFINPEGNLGHPEAYTHTQIYTYTYTPHRHTYINHIYIHIGRTYIHTHRENIFTQSALRQRMAEEESGAWGSVDTRDVIVRLTGQQTNHATSHLVSSSMLTLGRVLTHLANPIRRIFQLQYRGFFLYSVYFSVTFYKSTQKSNKQPLRKNTTTFGVWSAIFFFWSFPLFRREHKRDLIG